MKPILFNIEMVQAILEGRKTVTRRVVKFPSGWNPKFTGYIPDGAVLYGSNNIPAAKASYQTGDILWVRESWQFIPCIDCRLYVHGGCTDTTIMMGTTPNAASGGRIVQNTNIQKST